jgi:hypothetical protein
MLEAFDRIPAVPAPAGAALDLSDESARRSVRSGWLAGAWSRDGLWPAGDSGADSGLTAGISALAGSSPIDRSYSARWFLFESVSYALVSARKITSSCSPYGPSVRP